jgi:hypothetical protein
MKRRQFVAAAGVLLGARCAKATSGLDDEAAVKRVIGDYYCVFYRELDKQKYRALLTDDYLLLESHPATVGVDVARGDSPLDQNRESGVRPRFAPGVLNGLRHRRSPVRPRLRRLAPLSAFVEGSAVENASRHAESLQILQVTGYALPERRRKGLAGRLRVRLVGEDDRIFRSRTAPAGPRYCQ